VIDGTGTPPRDADVVIRDRRVEAGRSPGTFVPPEGDVIEAAGLTLLPGLIGCHDHFAWGGVSTRPPHPRRGVGAINAGQLDAEELEGSTGLHGV
jgi:imidazolonepropionase-like amidohydrolase